MCRCKYTHTHTSLCRIKDSRIFFRAVCGKIIFCFFFFLIIHNPSSLLINAENAGRSSAFPFLPLYPRQSTQISPIPTLLWLFLLPTWIHTYRPLHLPKALLYTCTCPHTHIHTQRRQMSWESSWFMVFMYRGQKRKRNLDLQDWKIKWNYTDCSLF